MATNLVSLVMQFLTPDMIAKIASALGLDRIMAQKAIGGAIPAILAGLANVASAPGGARQLSNAVAQQEPGMLDSLKSLIGGSGQKAFTDTGSSMLSGLLGGGTMDALTQSLGNFAGIGEGASKSLLGMLGPVVLGTLGQQQRSAGLDASGLASLLTAQKDQFASAIPSGLVDQLSAAGMMDRLKGGLHSSTAAASAAASRFGGAAERTVAGASQAAYATGNTAAYAARRSASSQWALWAIGLIALAALAWYLLASMGGDDKVAEAPRPAATETTTPRAAVTPPAATQADRAMETANVALTTPLTVGGVNLTNRVNASVDGLKTTLAGIKDTVSAEAALPKIRDAITQLDEVRELSTKLPPEGKSALAKMIAAAMPTVNQLCDKVLATPGVGGVAKPAIDELRGKLDMLARA
jgi:hypothetical protein